MPQTNLTKARANAKKIGVEVKVSTRKGKKLDVFKNGEKVASIGDINYEDFLTHGDEQRKKNYKSRHEKDRHKVGTASYYADQILWK
tara:strand:+ start:1135 stop:1395 length:261 start_codon:yes stop_codon:yes gene_type:complete